MIFKTLSGLTKATINTVVLPVEIVRDIGSGLLDPMSHAKQSHTGKRLDRIGENIDEIGSD